MTAPTYQRWEHPTGNALGMAGTGDETTNNFRLSLEPSGAVMVFESGMEVLWNYEFAPQDLGALSAFLREMSEMVAVHAEKLRSKP